jgi:hypothetical protein
VSPDLDEAAVAQLRERSVDERAGARVHAADLSVGSEIPRDRPPVSWAFAEHAEGGPLGERRLETRRAAHRASMTSVDLMIAVTSSSLVESELLCTRPRHDGDDLVLADADDDLRHHAAQLDGRDGALQLVPSADLHRNLLVVRN